MRDLNDHEMADLLALVHATREVPTPAQIAADIEAWRTRIDAELDAWTAAVCESWLMPQINAALQRDQETRDGD